MRRPSKKKIKKGLFERDIHNAVVSVADMTGDMSRLHQGHVVKCFCDLDLFVFVACQS